jgi:formate/nitrite transporter FocA (FNT family)
MRRDLVSTPQPVDVDRVIYATITLMSVLIIYDGWQQLRFIAVVGVIVGPVLAVFLAHVFSASLAQQLSLGKLVTMAGRMKIVRSESRFLLLCVPPVLLVGILVPLGVSISEAIRSVLVLGTVSLGFWGGVAGRRAGLRGWRLVRAVMAGLLIGGLILALQVFLQPGKAAS